MVHGRLQDALNAISRRAADRIAEGRPGLRQYGPQEPGAPPRHQTVSAAETELKEC
jgi:hypothetical protein